MMICFPEHATLVITFSLSALHLPSGLHLFFTLPLAGVSSFSQPPFHTEVQVNRSASSPSFAWLIPLTLHRSAPHAARTHLSKYRRTGKEKTEEARKELKGPSLRLLCTLSAAHWRCSWLHADQPEKNLTSADAGVWAPLDPSHSIKLGLCLTQESSLHLCRARCRQSEIESRWNFYDPCFLSLSAAAALHLARAGGCHCLSLPLLNLKKTRWGWRQRPGSSEATPASSRANAVSGMLFTGESRSYTWNHMHLVLVNMEYKPSVCLHSVSHVLVCVCVCVCVGGFLLPSESSFNHSLPTLCERSCGLVYTPHGNIVPGIYGQRVKAPPPSRSRRFFTKEN